ncbi:hypothetical protein WJX79_009611 [Trebouxia sp. C0005]
MRTPSLSLSQGHSSGKIATTLAGLDALLGVQEEKQDAEDHKASDEAKSSDKLTVDVSPDVVKSIAQADLGRRNASNGKGKDSKDVEKQLSDQMTRIVDRAKQLASQDTEQGKVTEQNLGKDFETLLGMLRPEESVNKDDIKILKEQIFGPNVFWVTETRATDDILDGGIVVRGNLRAPRDQVLETVIKGVKQTFGDKYQVFLVPDPDSEEADPKGGPRVAFQVLPNIVAQPKPIVRWQYAAATVLFGLTLLSATQLGLLANVSKLPKETIEWLARPENYDPDRTPPGLEGFDPVPFLLSSLPITASVMATQFVHELGHRMVAFRKKIKLGPSLFIPNSQIGTFGAVTQFKSLVKNNTDMFDVSFAGPAAAAATSLALFVVGLAWSTGGDIPKEALVPVPTQLFQGSLLLGSIANTVLGESAMRNANVLIHPLLIGGWCGLVATALNSLPVGSLDGGKMTQAAYGQSTLTITSFFTYVGLGLGFLGSSLALPFGLYVLICQRTTEKYVQDKITPAAELSNSFTVVTYNFLAQKYIDAGAHHYCHPEHRTWQRRWQRLENELQHYDADILCLQEVEEPVFHEQLTPLLAKQQMQGIYRPRQRGGYGPPEGVAFFFRTSCFELVKSLRIRLGDCVTGSGPFWQQVQQKGEGPVLALLKHRDTGKVILAGSVHLYFHPDWPDIKLAQAALLCSQAVAMIEGEGMEVADVPVVLGGDWNSLWRKYRPDVYDPKIPKSGFLMSGVYSLLTSSQGPEPQTVGFRPIPGIEFPSDHLAMGCRVALL